MYTKYIEAIMSQYTCFDAALTVEYDEEFVGTNRFSNKYSNDKFRK
jgi:hypothetical protein